MNNISTPSRHLHIWTSHNVKHITLTSDTMIFSRFTFTAALAASATSAISVERRAQIAVSLLHHPPSLVIDHRCTGFRDEPRRFCLP